MVYEKILNAAGKTRLALLIDPDKQEIPAAVERAQKAEKIGVSYILIGGSLLTGKPDAVLKAVKNAVSLPILLFPGSLMQLSDAADALMLLSLISGRNPDLLIGQHVLAAPYIKAKKIEAIPVGYILIDGGKTSSTQYVSNTNPIPSDKTDIASATAVAGELLGHKLIYLEAGSGAREHVPEKLIKTVKKNISVPLIVGGGVRRPEQIQALCKAGADIIVVGTAAEKNMQSLVAMTKALKTCSNL